MRVLCIVAALIAAQPTQPAVRLDGLASDYPCRQRPFRVEVASTDLGSRDIGPGGCALVSYAVAQVAHGSWAQVGIKPADSANIAFVRLMSLVNEVHGRDGRRDTTADDRIYYVTMLVRNPTRTREMRVSERTGEVGVFVTEPIDTAQDQQPPAGLLPQIERGEAVQVLVPETNSPWPRSYVYQFIAATPEQCAAVLSDYGLQSSYVPRLKESRVLRTAGHETDVEYVVSIPVFPDERSVSRQHVVRSGEEYRVEWHTVVDSANAASVTVGSATFRPMVNKRTGVTGTLMIHDQSVVPASVFARVPLVRNKAVQTSRDVAAAIAKQVEREVAREPATLKEQVAALHARLAK